MTEPDYSIDAGYRAGCGIDHETEPMCLMCGKMLAAPLDGQRLAALVEHLCGQAESREGHQHIDGPDCIPAVTVDDLRSAIALARAEA